ncbi:RagB/SusD family nutrient uptake outer membrane protein [Aureibaculum luteum]|uniref:RagB/SusD family nutrient uptake outer membrane protein n=1 Tax=Aureibaculum luteum TaxID=1548456 RepID=UPI000E4B337E|nr:RagB/SusD family nutrient uptake outer membrane protein [Aureibaculum luteum]
MKNIKNFTKYFLVILVAMVAINCDSKLDDPVENLSLSAEEDFTQSSNMISPLIGAYAQFYSRGWEESLLISVRGDDVNHGGLGDQQPFADTDFYNYDKDYWMYNSVWQNGYRDIFDLHNAMERIEKYKDAGADAALANQYVAEVKVLRAHLLFEISRLWSAMFITTSSDASELYQANVSSRDEVLQHISDQMDEAIPNLLDEHPANRADVTGGVTKHAALAIKARANLELKNYQAVAEATGQIISSNKFSLFPDFYEEFKTAGKLSQENILEMQYSDFGQGSGPSENHLWAPYGPQGWTPAVTGASAGWGFYEPSLKFIKFMLDRNETVRLETSVLFTDRGIAKIKEDPDYATLPSWISNTTRDGDVINDYARAMFASGKHYLPSNELIAGRTSYGSNKDFIVIRYSEVLLMYAEALTQGATGTGMTADQAVNLVRDRAGLAGLSGVTKQQVMDEKFAELGMEWGIRYYDMVRLGTTNELNYDDHIYSDNKRFLPFPQNQIDQIPALRAYVQGL